MNIKICSLILSSIILASCGGSDTAPPAPTPTTDPTDTANWSSWSQWSPTSDNDTSVLTITQTRTRTCAVGINGNADSPAPTCSGEASETQTVANPLAADTLTLGAWSDWTPTNNANTSILEITQTRNRSCEVVVNGTADNPALTCTGYTSETQTVINPLAADTLTLGAWSELDAN